MPASPLELLAGRLRAARRVTVLSGAGVSAASGVPTFRGPEGLWRRYRPEELATPQAFARDPHLVWEWYAWRRERIAACRPNAAHETLAAWSRAFPQFTLITQNVDGLHERAGTAHVVRFHGSIWELRCWKGCGIPPWPDDRVPFPELPPRCPGCGGLARPGVVWFGEAIDPAVLARCDEALACDLFLVAGTSSVVYPAAGLADAAAARGAFTVEVNPDVTEASARMGLSLRGSAEEILPALLNPEP
jgi:NAD-dependent deacetylase